MTRRRLLEALGQLNIWQQGDRRAPHKPLLLLLVLGRVRRGEGRLPSYERDVHQPLAKLLRDFGPPVKGGVAPDRPFWHLQSERLESGEGAEGGALWQVTFDDERFSPALSEKPRAAALKRHGAVGGLAEPLYRRLRWDSALVEAAAELLLDGLPGSHSWSASISPTDETLVSGAALTIDRAPVGCLESAQGSRRSKRPRGGSVSPHA